jgi:hypothetical protein
MTCDEQIALLVSRLENYGGHHRWCRYHNGGNDFDCNCGFVAALQEAVKLRQAANRRLADEIAPHALTGK